MLISLIIALLATFLWLNVTIADAVNRAHGENADNAVKAAQVKTSLAAIMAIFWAIVIKYGGIL